MESKDHFDRCSDCEHDLNFARTSPTGLLESEDGRDALEDRRATQSDPQVLRPATRTVECGVGPSRREATTLIAEVLVDDRLLVAGVRGGGGKERLTSAPKMTAKK